MNNEILKPGTQKRVNVFASIPVSMPHGLGDIGFSRTAPISGRQMGVMLPIEVIRTCILGRAQVDECLANGGLLRLTLANYNRDNNVTRDAKPQPVVVTPLQTRNGKIVPPPPTQKRINRANVGGVNVQPIIQSEEYHKPLTNDPFSDVQQAGSSTDSSTETTTVEDETSKTSEVVASEVQSTVDVEPTQTKEEQNVGNTDKEIGEITQPLADDPILKMVAQDQEKKEENPIAQSKPENNQSRKKKKR